MMTRAEPSLHLRPAKEQDAAFLAELWARSFPGEPRAEVRLERLRTGSGPYGGLQTCWVAEAENRKVGGVRMYPLRMHLGGRVYPVQGLAALAVAPDARRRGVGRFMCEAAMRHGREAGQALSALFPFRVGFYARLGYSLIGEWQRYRFRTAALPAFPGWERVRVLEDKEVPELVPSFYASMLSRSHGLVERSPAMWKHRLSDVAIYGVFGEGGDMAGYLMAEVMGDRGQRHRRTFRVVELLACDAAGYRALLGCVSVQRDQWEWVRYDALPGERFHHLLSDPRLPDRPAARGLWFPSATLLRGPMLRVLDVPQVLATLDQDQRRLHIHDEQLPQNGGVWEVGSADGPPRRVGEGTEGAGSDRAGNEGERGLPIGLFTELFVSGSLPGQAAARRGWNPSMGVEDFRLLDVF